MERKEKTKYEFWIDRVAKEVVEREKKLKRGLKVFRTESGIGASGIPHVGSMSDASRAFSVKLGIDDLGKDSEYIAFSDTRDGLRKVPSSLPDWLEKHIGQPVTDIPDPFEDGHANYGDHMSSLLVDALKQVGMKFTFISGADVYKKGLLNEQIEIILKNAERASEIIKKTIGQEKFDKVLPYFPVCENCGKIYTTRVTDVDFKSHKVSYVCDQEFSGENKNTKQKVLVKGCGHKGEASYFNGTGKLSWKVEFAARWTALGITFEALGKDIADSVKVNDAICREILKFEPPVHITYEMFLDKGGKKISKSIGNVFTPQVWLQYGSPQSLMLLMFKRFEGTRELGVDDIPKYMDEVDNLEEFYFSKGTKADERDKVNLSRLFEYIHFLNPPKKATLHVPFDVMLEVAKILPEQNQLDFAIKKLKEFGYAKEKITEMQREELERRLVFAKQWNEDFLKPEIEELKLNEDQKTAVKHLIELVEESKDADELQRRIFEISTEHNPKAEEFFKMVYRILLKANKGPRLGPYIFQRGKEEVIQKLREVL